MSVYTVEEKVQIIKWNYQGNSNRQICDLFQAQFFDRPVPNQSTIVRIINCFEGSGCVNSSHKKRKRTCDEDTEVDVLAKIEIEPTSSVRKISRECQASKSSVHKILRRNKYFPYKPQFHQELLETDAFMRSVFCEAIMEKCNVEENFPYFVCFTDECTFYLKADFNKQIHRHWAKENPHIVVGSRTQYPQKVNVWIGILKNKIVGPVIVDGNLNSEKYLNLLQNEIAAAFEEIAGNDEVWYLHDGCPAHNGLNVRRFLNDTFPNKWIGRGGEISWPPRSPDLNPCDYYFWPFIQNQLYDGTDFENIQALILKLRQICAGIHPRTLAKVNRNFYDRLGYCLANNGKLFEHLIN